jgi:hypothetical protein
VLILQRAKVTWSINGILTKGEVDCGWNVRKKLLQSRAEVLSGCVKVQQITQAALSELPGRIVTEGGGLQRLLRTMAARGLIDSQIEEGVDRISLNKNK